MKWWRYNGLSITFILLFVVTLGGQIFTGLREHNADREEKGAAKVSFQEYLGTGHFIQATFENWESEFLQMGLFVVMTIFLYQKGSSESKDPDKKEEVDEDPDPKKKGAPGPVKKGGWRLWLYKHSLGYALFGLFIISFFMHWLGSLREYNEEQALKGKPAESALEYLGNSRLWFESFQNWQSEFLSVFAIVVLTIFLRHKGSPQSKPVDAPHHQTGE
jgi:hypothetical protein